MWSAMGAPKPSTSMLGESMGEEAMAPTSKTSGGHRGISQEAFEALVKENMEDLGMDPDEALEDAIQTLTLQGVNLSGIIKCIPGVTSVKDDPVVQSLNKLKEISDPLISSESKHTTEANVDLGEMVEVLDRIYDLCSIGEGSDNASIATKNGAVELLTAICGSLGVKFEKPLGSGLRALSAILQDMQSRENFRQSGGSKTIIDILKGGNKIPDLLESGFSVVVAAATADEILKESFMDLNVDELIVDILDVDTKNSVDSIYHAIRVLLTPDDNRVLASQVYGYARRFAQVGIVNALVRAIGQGLSSLSLASVCAALKAVAVNDEICKSISDCGGLDAILNCMDDSVERNDKTIARACCSLLSKLAGSDANKSAIVEKGGLDRLMKLSFKFSEDPSVLQEIMSIITVLSLRSPENAARAIEAGIGELVIQAMQRFPSSYQMQRQSCFMIRNLVVRNPENRKILLSNGIEKIIRKAKGSHESCRDAATAALRDLGLDDYNA